MYGVNGSSDAISRDMNSLLHSSTFKHPADGEFAKIKQLISLDPYPDYDQQSQTQNQQDENQSSLLRYRSSPSSFFSNLLNENGDEEFPDPVTAASNHVPEERFFKRHHQQQKKSDYDGREFLDFLEYASPSSTRLKQERREPAIQNQVPPPPSTAAIHGCSSRRVPDLPPNNNTSSYDYANQTNLDCPSSFRASNSTSSNLIRQNSTPAGFLSSLNVENGFTALRKGSSSITSNSHISFSLGPSSSSRFLPQIPENENELHDSTFNGGSKRNRDGGLKISQNGETINHTPSLVHHMSLPKTSSEMAAAENFLHFQQESSVPWKTRAKRGFATHPRSIAERMRRTRISERIKRLQDLFPDMDKQTNTADMLDMAVEYIKDLQKELQTLNDARARCKCSSKQLQSGSNV